VEVREASAVQRADVSDSDDESIGDPDVQPGAITDRALADSLISMKILTPEFNETATIVRTTSYNRGRGYYLHLARHDSAEWVHKSDYTFLEVQRLHQAYLAATNQQAAAPVLDVAGCEAQLEVDLDAPPFVAHPPADMAPLAVPAGFASYTLKIPHEGVLLSAEALGRSITKGHSITWRLRLTMPDGTTFEHDAPHHVVVDAVITANRVAKVRAPQARTPTCDAFACGPPPRAWDTGHPMVGVSGRARVPLADDPVPAQSRHRGAKKPEHVIDVVGVKACSDDVACTVYLCRVVSKPSLSVVLTHSSFADAVHAHEVHRQKKRRAGKRGSRIAARDDLRSHDPDHPTLEGADLVAAIKLLAAKLPDEPEALFGLGLVADSRSLPTSVVRNYRRGLYSVAKLAASGDCADQRAGYKVLLSYHALVAPPVPDAARGVGVDRAKWIKGRVLLFRQGRWDELLASSPEQVPDDADVDAPPPPPPRADHYPMRRSPRHSTDAAHGRDQLLDPADRQALRAQYKLTALKSVSAASAQLFSPPSLPPAAPGAVSAALRKLHPQPGDLLQPIPAGPAPAGGDCPLRFQASQTAAQRLRSPLIQTPAPAGAEPLQFTADQYIKAVRRRDPGSAGGADGLSFLVLRSWFDCDDDLSERLAAAFNLILANKLDDSAQRLVNAARCCPIPKNEQGDIRPIAVGSVVGRLIFAMCIATSADALREYFMPLQFGLGVKGGCELLLTTVRGWLEDNPDHLMICGDAKNAFTR